MENFFRCKSFLGLIYVFCVERFLKLKRTPVCLKTIRTSIYFNGPVKIHHHFLKA